MRISTRRPSPFTARSRPRAASACSASARKISARRRSSRSSTPSGRRKRKTSTGPSTGSSRGSERGSSDTGTPERRRREAAGDAARPAQPCGEDGRRRERRGFPGFRVHHTVYRNANRACRSTSASPIKKGVQNAVCSLCRKPAKSQVGTLSPAFVTRNLRYNVHRSQIGFPRKSVGST